MNFDLEIEPDYPEVLPAVIAQAPLMEVLGADVALPSLIKFVPDARLRAEADVAATEALRVDVTAPGGLARADTAATTLRAALKAIEGEFKEPKAAANRLHKRLTSLEGEWRAEGDAALKVINARLYNEQQRLARLEADERRRVQEAADAQAREAARAEAQAAVEAKAPAEVVEELIRTAETVSAPPVMSPTTTTLAGSTPIGVWKSRFVGTTGDQEPNPDVEDMSAIQKMRMREVARAVLDDKAPMQLLKMNWAYANARAKADKNTMAIPGLEAYQEGSMRGKSGRAVR